MSDATGVLDASALLALLQGEPGSEVVAALLAGCAMSSVNLSEVAAKLSDRGMPAEQVHAALDGLPIDIHPFDQQSAYAAGELRRVTRAAGLSLGDRACLALAGQLGVAAVTSDRAWGSLPGGPFAVRLIR